MKRQAQNNYLITFAKGSFISVIGAGLLGLLNYFIRRHLALNLSLENFGFLYSAMSLCMVFLAYLDLGLNQSATILISKSISKNDYTEANTIYNQTFFIKLVLSLTIYLGLISTYKFWLNSFFHYSNALPFIFIITIIITGTISSISGMVLNALKKFLLLNIIQITNPAIIFILILFLPKSIYAASIAFPLGGLVLFLLITKIVRRFKFSFVTKYMHHLKGIGDVFSLSKWIAISTAGLSTMYYMDSIILTYIKGLEVVALYNVALSIMLIAQSLMVLPSVFLPIVSEMWGQNKTKEISDISKLLTDTIIYLLWPIIISMIFLSKYLIVLLFSEKFISAENALIILYIGIIFYSLGSFYIGVLISGDYAKNVSLAIIALAILNILLNICLIPYLGISGAACSTALSYLIMSTYLFFCIKAKLGTYVVSIMQLIYCSISGIACVIGSLLFSNKSFKCDIILLLIFNIVYLGTTFKILRNYYNSMIFYWSLISHKKIT